jgi:glucose dehydrogenase
LALNITSGAWIWGFQSSSHDLWDYDCSWWQAQTTETIAGVSTPVILKTCKSGYVYEINALTGSLIWAWIPPTSIVPRGQYNYNWNPLNATQTGQEFVQCAAFAASCANYISFPFTAGFEDEQSYSPVTNLIYAASELTPANDHFIPFNSSNYFTNRGDASTPLTHIGACANCKPSNNNSTIWGIDAATGQVKWHYFIPLQGIRGGVSNSGNIVFVTLSSGDMLMLDATTGALVRDFYVGAPMDVLPSVGASANGTVTILQPVGTCGGGAVLTCPGTVPGDIIALTLHNVPAGGGVSTTTTTTTTTTTLPGQTITTTLPGGTVVTTTLPGTTVTSTVGGGAGSTTTVTSVSTAAGSGGVSSTTLYGVAAVAVIFIIATGYLAMRGRKPAS